jgi:hypothetical protein
MRVLPNPNPYGTYIRAVTFLCQAFLLRKTYMYHWSAIVWQNGVLFASVEIFPTILSRWFRRLRNGVGWRVVME